MITLCTFFVPAHPLLVIILKRNHGRTLCFHLGPERIPSGGSGLGTHSSGAGGIIWKGKSKRDLCITSSSNSLLLLLPVRLSARQKRPNFLLDGERATATEAGEALPKVATKISPFFYIGTGTRTVVWI